MTKIFVNNKKTLIIIAVSIVLVACLIIANYLSIYLLQAGGISDEVTVPEVEIHMLSLSKSKVEKEAKSIAPDYQEIGAGGFIWKKGEYFHVISSAYLNKNDAELVRNSIKLNQNIDSEIFTIKFPAFSIKGSFTGDEKKVVTKALLSAQSFYTSIYDIAVSIDTGVLSEISAKLSVNNTINNISTTYANFETLYPNAITNPMKELSAYLKSLLKITQQLASDERISTAQTYSSHLKYRYLEVLNAYYDYIASNK